MFKSIARWWADTDNIGCAVMGILSIGFGVFTCWLIYKILVAVYHLIDKLIDKL